MDFIAIIILLGIVQGFFLGSVLLLIRSPNQRANRFFGVLYLCFSISISHFFLERTGLLLEYPHLIRVSFPVLFLFGPLFLFYVRVLTNRTVELKPAHLLHAIPFVVSILLSLPFFMLSGEEKLHELVAYQDTIGVHMGLILGLLQVCHVSAYLLAVRRELRRYDERIKNTKSSLEHINLRWLWVGTINFIVVFVMIFVMILLQASGLNVLPIYNVAVPISVSVIIYYMGYLGLRQPTIFSPIEELGTASRKYEKSALTQEKGRELAARLTQYMERERPYLDSELTLPKLAEMLQVPPHHLSQVINEFLGQNFFDFVNAYRVDEARRLLQNPEKAAFTVLAVAEEAGFNSKTAFNTAFKKVAGQTPSEFRAQSLVLTTSPN
jgi:AraC-like DNA-binding protein